VTPPSAYNDWKLVSLSPLPPWALALLALGVLVGILLAAWGVRSEPVRWRRGLLWALRVGAGVAALFFLLEPGVRDLQVARVKNRVAVLVDRSASMGFPVEPGGKTRSEAAADALEALAPQLAAQGDRFTFETYGFDPELTPFTPERLRAEPARGGRSDLLSALRAAQAGGGGKKLSGVLLLSDGADNAELAQGAVGKARAALADLGVPVNTVLVGKSALKDLAVERVQVDDFAFVRNSLTVEVELRARGFAGRTVPLTLTREGQVVATKQVTFSADDTPVRAAFTFTPDQTGRFVYSVSLPVFPDEAVAENNSRAFVLKVIRDRVRVLLVVGRPSWDERFLRGLLKQDPNVDLVSFYILRTHSDDPRVVDDRRELSLIPFPMEEIFRTKLSTFDVVIFQNFGYVDPALSINEYEEDLVRYVQEGGALVMVGGDAVLGAGKASFPQLERVLPLEGAAPPALEPFVARLTPEGLRHPVTALGTGSAGSEQVWASLPPVAGANVTRVREGATVLLDHPFQTHGGRNLPLVAVWEQGRGRAMTVASDGTWAWAFTANKDGTPSRAHGRFWSNALRWLVRDPDLTTLNVTADPPSVEPGRPVAAVVSVRTSDYRPAEGAQVRVELESVGERKVLGAQSATTGPDGTVRVEFPPPAAGAYKVKASATARGGGALGEGEDAVAVRSVGPELADASVRPALLQQISELTGGRFQSAADGASADALALVDPPVVEVGRSKDRPLWDRPSALLALVALLGAEWFLRRRFGYV
jgi:uncharacterized membrane protein